MQVLQAWHWKDATHVWNVTAAILHIRFNDCYDSVGFPVTLKYPVPWTKNVLLHGGNHIFPHLLQINSCPNEHHSLWRIQLDVVSNHSTDNGCLDIPTRTSLWDGVGVRLSCAFYPSTNSLRCLCGKSILRSIKICPRVLAHGRWYNSFTR